MCVCSKCQYFDNLHNILMITLSDTTRYRQEDNNIDRGDIRGEYCYSVGDTCIYVIFNNTAVNEHLSRQQDLTLKYCLRMVSIFNENTQNMR